MFCLITHFKTTINIFFIDTQKDLISQKKMFFRRSLDEQTRGELRVFAFGIRTGAALQILDDDWYSVLIFVYCSYAQRVVKIIISILH